MGWVEAANWYFILTIAENAALLFCTWYFVSHIEQTVKKPGWVKLSAFAVYGLACGLFAVYLDSGDYTGLGRLLLMAAMTVLSGHFLYNRRRMYLFYFFMFPISVYIMQTLVSYMVFSYSVERWGLIAYDYYVGSISLITRILSLFLLTGVWILFLNRKTYENISRLQFAGLFLPPLFSIFIIITLIMIGNIYVQMYGAFLIVTDIAFLVFMNLYILYLFSYLSRNHKLHEELEMLRNQREMQYSYYETMERKYRESRKMVHDIRNHLQAIESLLADDEYNRARAYADDLHRMLNALAHTEYTPNRMLNIILNDKAEAAGKEQIRMEIDVGAVPIGHLKEIDITTIFANLLDNALEAAGEAETDKYIKFSAGTFHEFIVVKITNSMCPPGSGEKRRKPTTGKQEHMGIGLENVRVALKEYGGGIHVETEADIYKVSLMIPIPHNHSSQEETK